MNGGPLPSRWVRFSNRLIDRIWVRIANCALIPEIRRHSPRHTLPAVLALLFQIFSLTGFGFGSLHFGFAFSVTFRIILRDSFNIKTIGFATPKP
jgi:hypothetical protein